MGYEDPKPWAIRTVVILSKAAVVGMFLMVGAAFLYGEWGDRVEQEHLRENEARTAAEWREAVHQWNQGAQKRRAMQAEMDQLRATIMASKQASLQR